MVLHDAEKIRCVDGKVRAVLNIFGDRSDLKSRSVTRPGESLKTPTNSAKNKCLVASESLLADITPGALAVAFLSEQVIFAQGDKDGAVFYIQEGKVPAHCNIEVGSRQP